MVCGDEIGYRVSLRARVYNPVRGGSEGAVCPSLHHVADVDDIRLWNDWHIDPYIVARHHLQTLLALMQQGQTFVIGVRTHVDRMLDCRRPRPNIVEETKLRDRL